jgi:hypothetical protein
MKRLQYVAVGTKRLVLVGVQDNAAINRRGVHGPPFFRPVVQDVVYLKHTSIIQSAPNASTAEGVKGLVTALLAGTANRRAYLLR